MSPSQQFEIIWKEPKDDNDSHHLFYRNAKSSSAPYEFLSFARSVCVHWSPDEKYFALSNYMGSNIATVYIIKSTNTSERVDIRDLLPTRIRRLLIGISHGYIEAALWNKRGLIIRAWGDRDTKPKEFDMKLRCAEKHNKWICKKIMG